MERLFGTFGTLEQPGEVASFRNDHISFRTVLEHYGTQLMMVYFKVREMEVHERGLTILEEIGFPKDPENVQGVKLSFEVPEGLSTETKDQVFRGMKKAFDKNNFLTHTTNGICRTIFEPWRQES